MRIDKFLKSCRLIKRRTIAQEACSKDRILINGAVAKPSKTVKIGDIVEILFGNRVLKVKVVSLQESIRKEDAATMYEVIE